MKKATTIEEQMSLLEDRGMVLDDGKEKTQEELLDIGYYRLGFYCFPFEKDYPTKSRRDHQYKEGTKFSDVIKLYYLDVDLRNILLKYISRIEINFKTKIVYFVSNKYKDNPLWFVDPAIMGKGFIANFDKKVYTETFKNNSVIKNHHRKHPKDAYAPAWKTLEFMTFGSIFALFLSIKDKNIQKDIAKCFNISSVDIFISYIRSIVTLRNTCAHCGVLFDFTLPQSILRGPALKINNTNKNILYPVIQIILFVLTEISTNRANDMKQKIIRIFEKHKENEVIKGIIETKIGYSF